MNAPTEGLVYVKGCARCGMVDDACRLFEEMPERNVVSWTSMLCGFANSGRIEEALRVFDVMPERNIVSWNSMVVGLIRNGDLQEARGIFDLMPERNVVSWNVMIQGYVENGRMDEARSLFDKMEEHNVLTWTSLVSGYCRVGNVEEGYYLFCRMPDRNIVSWTAMMGGFAWNGFYKEAFLLFLEMQKNHDIKLSIETIISLAYSCAGIGFPCLGKQLHAHVIVNSWAYDDYDGRLYESLIHMYSTCGIMDFASYLFLQNWKNCTTKCCNSMISGYILSGELEKARIVFESMPCPDKISYTAMINGYFNFGQVARACQTFNDMPNRDPVAWTTMISGHVQNELLDEAMHLFEEMRLQGFQPMNSTYSTLLGAAGAMANLDQGRQLHGLISKAQGGFDLILENSLISMYAKCQYHEEGMLREMNLKRVRKVPGCSWISLEGKVHQFFQGDRPEFSFNYVHGTYADEGWSNAAPADQDAYTGRIGILSIKLELDVTRATDKALVV
ncbi:Pentatricopeptide repeat [Dillenia turbinata]|uniref:Pentatricopeptide repeat n=1 Tax=Dillenia turbinata TaxID=194707 RepID=A0AAN8ZEE5_9MAGN